MEPKDFALIIAHIKGSPLSTLMILYSLQQPVDEQTLCLFSGYCIRSVKDGLQTLLLLDLVEYSKSTNGWRASPKALELLRQLTGQLKTSGENPDSLVHFVPEMKNIYSTDSSRSRIMLDYIQSKKKLRQPPPKPPPPKKTKRINPKTSLPDDLEIQQAYLLLVRSGIPNHVAENAINVSMKAGWAGEKIFQAVKDWFEYAASEKGETIKQPGFFIASRLTALQEPPEPGEEIDEHDPHRYTKGKYGHLIKH